MRKKVLTQHKTNGIARTFIFKVIVEPDEDGWFAHCPVLEKRGAATWGQTREEAARKIQEVLEMVVEDIIETGEAMPVKPEKEKQKVFFNPLVTVRV